MNDVNRYAVERACMHLHLPGHSLGTEERLVVPARDFDSVQARVAQLDADRKDDDATFNRSMESLQKRLAAADCLIREAWRLMDGQDARTAEWHLLASEYINAIPKPTGDSHE